MNGYLTIMLQPPFAVENSIDLMTDATQLATPVSTPFAVELVTTPLGEIRKVTVTVLWTVS